MAENSNKPVTLDELLALNDEVASLIRAGVPLELGLRQLSSSALGGLSRLSGRLVERMEAGASLQQALRDEGDHVPGVYLSVVEAGRRSGRLPEALETVSVLSRSLQELHRRAVLALMHPMLVLILTYVLLIFMVWGIVPILSSTYQELRFEPGWVLRTLDSMRDSLPVWGPGVPILVVVGASILNRTSSYADTASSGRLVSGRIQSFRWVPWFRAVMHNYDRATFSQLLSLLVKHEAPLHEAILLSAHATGNARIVNGSTRLAERLQSGIPLSDAVNEATTLPAFLRWMLVSGQRHDSLAPTLHQASDVYQRRAEHQIEWIRATLPIVLTCTIGGSAALLYALALFAPVLEMYSRLADPVV